MLWKNDGFFLLELLLSLSALFMLCIFFIPLLLDITNQSQQLVRNKKAKQFLYEELQANLTTGLSNTSYSVYQNGIEYKIYWIQSSANGHKEACVKVDENTVLPPIEICAVPE